MWYTYPGGRHRDKFARNSKSPGHSRREARRANALGGAVGPNGSGKSTVLDALFIVANKDPQQAAKEVLSGIPAWIKGPVGLFG